MRYPHRSKVYEYTQMQLANILIRGQKYLLCIYSTPVNEDHISLGAMEDAIQSNDYGILFTPTWGTRIKTKTTVVTLLIFFLILGIILLENIFPPFSFSSKFFPMKFQPIHPLFLSLTLSLLLLPVPSFSLLSTPLSSSPTPTTLPAAVVPPGVLRSPPSFR